MNPIHMSAGQGFVDPSGVVWTPNIGTGWVPFINAGTFPNPIYNTPAYTAVAGVPIVCTFALEPGQYRVLVHCIEAVRSFNAPQKRVFNVTINGDPFLTNFDVFQAAGGVEIPFVVSTIATALSDGTMTISFTQVKSSAMFAGIEIIPVSQVGGVTLLNPDGTVVTGSPASTIQLGAGLLWVVSGNFVQMSIDIAYVRSVLFPEPPTPPADAVAIVSPFVNSMPT